VTAVLCLLALDEFKRYGVDDLMERYRQAGLGTYHVPTLDGGVPSDRELEAAVRWVESQRTEGQQLLVHCVGGLGRAGTVVACWLRSHGLSTEDAIAAVRSVRSQRAVETEIQERTIARFRT
jgi:protein-tyrosine phosphatase